MPVRVVFDCNVFLQALISSTGPAAKCLDAVISGELSLFYSDQVLAELRDVALRPHLVARFGLTEEKVRVFIEKATKVATLIEKVPHVFEYKRDPDDEHYVDLAIAVKARLLVSRDKDLLALNDPELPEGKLLHELHPEIEILNPSEMIARLEPNG